MKILDRYVLATFLRALPFCLIGAAAIFVMFDFFVRIGDFAEQQSSALQIFAYFVCKLPRTISQIYPAAVLFAVLVGVGPLAEQREVLAMRTCGISSYRMLVPLAIVGVFTSLAVLAWNETVVPPAAGRARFILDVGIRKRLQSGVYNASWIWFQTDQGFVNVDYFDAITNVLHGVTLHEMGGRFRLERLVEVPEASWTGSEWTFSGGSVTTFTSRRESTIRGATADDFVLDVAPEELRNKRRQSYEFSYRDLSRQVQSLRRKGLDAREYVVDLYFKLAWPFSGVVSILMGVPLAVRAGKRGSGVLRNVPAGLALSFAYWSLTALSVAAGHTGTLPPVVAAWGPNLVAMAGATVFYVAGER